MTIEMGGDERWSWIIGVDCHVTRRMLICQLDRNLKFQPHRRPVTCQSHLYNNTKLHFELNPLKLCRVLCEFNGHCPQEKHSQMILPPTQQYYNLWRDPYNVCAMYYTTHVQLLKQIYVTADAECVAYFDSFIVEPP